MATWNYRVLRTEHESGDVLFRIHEVHYDDDGVICSWTEDPVLPCGESTGELREDIRYFLAAFRKPVLEEAEECGKPVLGPAYPEEEVNAGHYFELMDRASVALDHCREFVGSHPLARRNDRLRALYERAEEALCELYQEAARLEFERCDG
jgi:hypothetical protein